MNKGCYGKMLPTVIGRPDNVTVAGELFSYYIKHPGPMVTDGSVPVNHEAWRRCVACAEHESCYRLWLLLEIALSA